MSPRNGVRFILHLCAESPEIVYGFRAEAAQRLHEGRVRVTPSDGRVQFEDCDGLPEVLEKSLRALLRSLWRPRSPQGRPWPRRLQRWRDLDPSG